MAKLLVKFKSRPSDGDIGTLKGHGAKIKRRYKHLNALALSIDDDKVEKIRRHPGVILIEEDGEVHVVDEYTLAWGVEQVGCRGVHGAGIMGGGVKVAVIDTGVDYNHAQLRDIYRGGWDFVNDDADPMDDHYHGTFCAGVVAAALDGVSVVGMAPHIELYALKVLSSSGSGSISDTIAAVEWCIDHGIHITSNSYGGGYSAIQEEAFNAAQAAGVLLIAAAGNSGGSANADMTAYPARLNSVVAVAATDRNKLRATFSSTGPATELAAPGQDITSCALGGGERSGSGTSFACPHVAGLAALVKCAHPDWNGETIRGQLRASCDDLSPAGFDWLTGYGLINAGRAVGSLIPNPPPAPVVGPKEPPVADTLPPTNIKANEVTLNGELVSLGDYHSVECEFRINRVGATPAWNKTTAVLTAPGRYSLVVSSYGFNEPILPDTEYYYMATAHVTDGYHDGPMVIFRTPPEGPPPVTHTLNLAVSPGDGGTTSPVPGDHTYDDGEVAVISAAPAAGFTFDHWDGEVTDPLSTVTSVVMDADKLVVAIFKPLPPPPPPKMMKVDFFDAIEYSRRRIKADVAVVDELGSGLAGVAVTITGLKLSGPAAGKRLTFYGMTDQDGLCLAKYDGAVQKGTWEIRPVGLTKSGYISFIPADKVKVLSIS